MPSLFDKASKELTIVVPAYNEELRLSLMLDETFRSACLLDAAGRQLRGPAAVPR